MNTDIAPGHVSPINPSHNGECDSHLHIFDPRFPETPDQGPPLEGMTLADYRKIQHAMGTTRAVIVQAKRYGVDNRCLLDAIAQFHEEPNAQARGIAVVSPQTSTETLKVLDTGGVRGLRFSVWNPQDTVMSVDMIEPLAQRIAALGWHAQIHMSGDQIVEHAALLSSLPCPIVIDHMARLPPKLGQRHPAFGIVLKLLDTGRCWLKLSGAYLNTAVGAPYSDATLLARAYVQAAPERLVWGSDWPHVTEHGNADTPALKTLLEEWAPDDTVRRRILVGNPAQLYGFA